MAVTLCCCRVGAGIWLLMTKVTLVTILIGSRGVGISLTWKWNKKYHVFQYIYIYIYYTDSAILLVSCRTIIYGIVQAISMHVCYYSNAVCNVSDTVEKLWKTRQDLQLVCFKHIFVRKACQLTLYHFHSCQ